MKKIITGALSVAVLSIMLCACGCQDGKLEPNATNTPNATNSPITDIMPDMTTSPNGQSDGMTSTDGMK